MDKTLNDLRVEIMELVDTIDTKPFSSNLISLTLSQIDAKYGVSEASKTIDMFNLGAYGYSKKEEVKK